MMKSYLVAAVSASVIALASIQAPVAAAAEPETETVDGLVLRIDDRHRKFYVAPDADFSGYTKYVLVEPTIAFRKNWQRDSSRNGRRVSDAHMEEIRTVAAELLDETFREELAKGGYTAVDTRGDDVIIFRPAIVNLDIVAPDVRTSGRSYSWTDSSMSATLVLEMFDSVTGAPLAMGASAQRESSSGFMTRANSVTNRADAKRIYTRWAKNLRAAWDNARSGSPTTGE